MLTLLSDHLPTSEVSSSSEDPVNVANNVLDGNLKTYYLSSTAIVTGEWVQLKLENVALVSKVVITESAFQGIDKNNKKNEYRLKSLDVRVGNTQTTRDNHGLINQNDICDTFSGPGMREEEIVLTCEPSAIKGQFVTVHKIDQSILNIAEIKVIGKEMTFDGTKKGKLLAVVDTTRTIICSYDLS